MKPAYSVLLLFLLFLLLPPFFIMGYAIIQEVIFSQSVSFEGNLSIKPYFALSVLLTHTTLFLLLLRFLKKRDQKLTAIGWIKPSSFFYELIIGAAAALLIYLMKEVVFDSIRQFIKGQPPMFTSLFSWEWNAAKVPLLLAGTLLVFVEESIFRGYFYFVFKNRYSSLSIALISSLAFGLGHAFNGVLSIFFSGLIGLIFFIIFIKRKNLYAPTFAHAFYNFLVIMTI